MPSPFYPWTDGASVQRKGDPLNLLRRLNVGSPKGDLNVLLDMAESPEETEAIAAAEALAALVCRVFRLGSPWNEEKGEGVMEADWRPILDGFLSHLEKNGLPAGGEPTSQPSSAPESSASPEPTGSACP